MAETLRTEGVSVVSGIVGRVRVSVGIAMSDVILLEDIGRPAMVQKIAAGMQVALKRSGITDPADVHYAQTKMPLLTSETINDAKSRGQTVFSDDIHASMPGMISPENMRVR